jgi:hypothetical protein
MLNPALPTDKFWDSAIGCFVSPEAVMALGNPVPSIAKLMAENISVVEDFIRSAEELGFNGPRCNPAIMLRNFGLDPSKFDLDALRNRRVPPTRDGVIGIERDLVRQVEDRGRPPPIDVSQLTDADWEAIGRLQQLGNFPESRAVQAYFMTQKNETWAAEFLLEYSGMSDPGH